MAVRLKEAVVLRGEWMDGDAKLQMAKQLLLKRQSNFGVKLKTVFPPV